MNNTRRKALNKIREQIEDIKMAIEELRDEEQEYLDNIPENLHGGEKYEKAINAVYEMDDAINNLDAVLENIENAVE